MFSSWLPFFSAILGALVGASAPVIVSIVTQRSERRRERSRLAMQAAMEELKHHVTLVGGQLAIPPLSTFFFFHLSLLEAVERGPLRRC